MKPGVKIALGVCTSLATAGFIFVYDFYIKDRIDSEEVIVVKAGEQILKSEQIDKRKLSVERRAKAALVDGVILAKDMKDIIGKDTNQVIVGNSMISSKMIDYDLMVPDPEKGEAIRPITKEMIFAQPGSLRRKDVVDIYLVYKDKTSNLMVDGPDNVSSDNDNKAEINITTNQTLKGMVDTKPFLKGIKVVYVKDSGNKEVTGATEKGQDGSDKRLNASSTISDLEVILNEDDFTKLMTEILQKGAELYITYQ